MQLLFPFTAIFDFVYFTINKISLSRFTLILKTIYGTIMSKPGDNNTNYIQGGFYEEDICFYTCAFPAAGWL